MSGLGLRDALRRFRLPAGTWGLLSLALAWSFLAGVVPASHHHEVAETAVVEPGESGEDLASVGGPPVDKSELAFAAASVVFGVADARVSPDLALRSAPTPPMPGVDVGERRRWRTRALGSRGPPTDRV
jgi:hypothetical protein